MDPQEPRLWTGFAIRTKELVLDNAEVLRAASQNLESRNIDFSTIEHLDFDISENYDIQCDGIIPEGPAAPGDTEIHCTRPAVVMANRACCGHIDLLCVRCHNGHLESVLSSKRRGVARPCKFCRMARPIPPYSSTSTI